MKWIKRIMVLTLVIGMTVCAYSEEKAFDKIDFGTLENGKYKNEFFGMRLKLPDDWYAMDDDTRMKMMETAKKMLSGEDKNMKAILDASELNSVNLFMVNKHPLGTAVSFNPGLACVAEKVGHLPGIKKGSDYLYHAKKLMQASQIKYIFPKEPYAQKIGGNDFDVQDVEVHIKGMTIYQKYYAAILKGYALSFIISSATQEEEENLKQILETVQFER